jgi:hypothetical protein
MDEIMKEHRQKQKELLAAGGLYPDDVLIEKPEDSIKAAAKIKKRDQMSSVIDRKDVMSINSEAKNGF